MIILGTTATGNLEDCRTLGMERATRFCTDLTALGVNPGQLIAISAGCEGTGLQIGSGTTDFYHQDIDPVSGEWLEEVARTNRAIHIIPYFLADDVLVRFA